MPKSTVLTHALQMNWRCLLSWPFKKWAMADSLFVTRPLARLSRLSPTSAVYNGGKDDLCVNVNGRADFVNVFPLGAFPTCLSSVLQRVSNVGSTTSS